jgi:hypothetical protein
LLLAACAGEATTPAAITEEPAPATLAPADTPLPATATVELLQPTSTGQPEPTATDAPILQCTPPACASPDVLTCPEGDCPGGCGTICAPAPEALAPGFDGERAYEELLAQVELGPRIPGSPGHTAAGDLILATLDEAGWATEEQPLTYQGVEGRNLIARANDGAGPVILLGAHYDSRAIADQSLGEQASQPVPGAVDGASGVAVLLELARTLDLDSIPHEVWLAFFDMEDQGSGGMPGWDWIVGSTYMAQNLTVTPEAMVLVDMIGDAEQQIFFEGYSDPELRAELWRIAAGLGYDTVFVPQVRHSMLDDHRPFLERGIPAVDIIDFDYRYWHTVEDTADKAAPESLERVGRTLEAWLENKP